MRTFKTKIFERWAVKIKLSDSILRRAIEEIAIGQYEANLGGSIYKKRIALGNKGKRSGARTIIAFKYGDRAFFLYGFAKSHKSGLALEEVEALKELAKIYLAYKDEQIIYALKTERLIEVI